MRPTAWPGPAWALAAAAVAALALSAWADSVKIGGRWYGDLVVQDIGSGRLTHVNAAGTEIATDLVRIGAIKVDAYPDLGRAADALEAGDDRAAAALLAPLGGRVREPWLRGWVSSQQMLVASRLGDGLGAVRALVELVRLKADDFYFQQPPVGVFATAGADLTGELRRRLEAARRGAGPRAKQALETMLLAADARADALEALAKAPAAPPAPVKSAPHSAASVPAPAAPAPTPSASPAHPTVVLPRTAEGDDPVSDLLRAGRFAEALEQLDRSLEQSAEYLARRLHQRGLARLGLAEQTGDLGQYKSAGLDFMRVVFYRPKADLWVGPALMEAGYVHHRIGRDDLARRLLDRARLLIREDEQPELAARLTQLSAGLGARPLTNAKEP